MASRKASFSSRSNSRKGRKQWFGDEPMPTQLNASQASDWVSDILEEFSLSEGLEEGQLRESWERVAGKFIASQTEVVSFKHRKLMLRVMQPAMRFHLEQERGALLARLKRELGNDVIHEVRLVTG